MSITDSVITGLFSLIGVILGFLLNLITSYFSFYKERKEEFLEIKNSIYYTTSFNNVSRELLKLKKFFIRYPKYIMKRKENKEFFNKWLLNYNIEIEEETNFQAHGFWNQNKFIEMISDLEKVKI